MKEQEGTLTIKVEEEIMDQYNGIEDLIYTFGEDAPYSFDIKKVEEKQVTKQGRRNRPCTEAH